MINCAPILLFTYKRLHTLKLTVSALQQNYLANESELFIFSDAAKSEDDQKSVTNVREYLKTITGFKCIHIVESNKNKGLANSIISGVTNIIDKHDKVIVLEDDLITTPNFLLFMNKCLNKYEQEKQVFSVSGYSFNLGKLSDKNQDVYFLNRGWSWGWATWKDRWSSIDWEVKDYLQFKSDSNSRKDFSKGGSDLNKMLEKQMSGKLDSWAIRWFYHQYKVKGLTLYPVFSKIHNNGFDNYATNTSGSSRRYTPALDLVNKTEFKFPDNTELDLFYQRRFQNKMGIISRAVSKLETIFQNFIK